MPFITPLQNTEIARVVGEFIDTVWYEISAAGFHFCENYVLQLLKQFIFNN